MPTIARKQINKKVEEFSAMVSGKILFVGVNHQWERQYREWFKESEFVTMDINEDTVFKPDIIGDIQKCPEIPDGSYDAVIMTGIWEYLRSPSSAVDEIYRILKPTGNLLFGFPGESFHPQKTFSLEKIKKLFEEKFFIDDITRVDYRDEDPFYWVGTAVSEKYEGNE